MNVPPCHRARGAPNAPRRLTPRLQMKRKSKSKLLRKLEKREEMEERLADGSSDDDDGSGGGGRAKVGRLRRFCAHAACAALR